jgi:hypothetical protein
MSQTAAMPAARSSEPGGRPDTGKSDRLKAAVSSAGGPEVVRANNGDRGGGAVAGVGIGSGRVLGSAVTDTLGAELGYGVDGKTELTFFGRSYIFAPVSMEDHDEASADLERLHLALIAFGMVKPLSPASEITPQDLAQMLRVLSNQPTVSELSACANVTMMFGGMGKEERHAVCRLFWFSFRRWDENLEFQQVLRIVDYSNMPILLRLWFRKNLGVLDRFLQRLSELLPDAPETAEGDLSNPEPMTEAEAEEAAQEFARLMSENAPVPGASEPRAADLPQTEEPEEPATEPAGPMAAR